MAALKGKRVYLEKPMTKTIDEEREIAEVSRTGAKSGNGRVFQVGSHTPPSTMFKAQKAIQDGLIGKLVWVTGYFSQFNKEAGEWN